MEISIHKCFSHISIGITIFHITFHRYLLNNLYTSDGNFFFAFILWGPKTKISVSECFSLNSIDGIAVLSCEWWQNGASLEFLFTISDKTLTPRKNLHVYSWACEKNVAVKVSIGTTFSDILGSLCVRYSGHQELAIKLGFRHLFCDSIPHFPPKNSNSRSN